MKSPDTSTKKLGYGGLWARMKTTTSSLKTQCCYTQLNKEVGLLYSVTRGGRLADPGRGLSIGERPQAVSPGAGSCG